MRIQPTIATVIEMDGHFYRWQGDELTTIADLRGLPGDKRLVTDFQEGSSRVMTVEGPLKYSELLVRRKLQESGEFEEPVRIITHWKKKRGKNTTDIFFTAVPTRLASFYFDELRNQAHITLVFSVGGILWEVVKKNRSKAPMAVVLRHDRFAELLIGSADRVYFSGRCVAFDSAEEQIQALWETIRSDIEAVANENRVEISRVVHLNWLAAHDTPIWPEQWQERFITLEQQTVRFEEEIQPLGLLGAVKLPSARHSVSPGMERGLYYTRRWAPLFNLGLALAVFLLLAGMVRYQRQTQSLEIQQSAVQHQITQIHFDRSVPEVPADFAQRLTFLQKLARQRHVPSYQEVINDLSRAAFGALQLQRLKVDYAPERLAVELYGDIQAPFDQAHSGYQIFLQKLERLGYVVEENRFETQISQSKVVLKLSRPIL